MKRGMDFFGTPKRRSRVQCHVDGISIPGVGSMRLSNIPKNLWKMCNLLVTASQKTSSILLYGFTLCAVGVRGYSCRDPGGSFVGGTNLYLNYTQEDAFLLIKSGYALIFPNNTCNFSIAEKQSGNYIFNGCACYDNLGHNYNAFLYGQNITEELINCIAEHIKCVISGDYKMVGIIVGAIVGCIFLTVIYVCFDNALDEGIIGSIKRLNQRNEEKRLLNSGRLLELKQTLSNPMLDENPPTEPPAENNGWCCCRR